MIKNLCREDEVHCSPWRSQLPYFALGVKVVNYISNIFSVLTCNCTSCNWLLSVFYLISWNMLCIFGMSAYKILFVLPSVSFHHVEHNQSACQVYKSEGTFVQQFTCWCSMHLFLGAFGDDGLYIFVEVYTTWLLFARLSLMLVKCVVVFS